LKEKVQARLAKFVEGGSSRIGATVDLNTAATIPDVRERLSKLENDYRRMLEHVHQLTQQPPKPKSKWKLADKIYTFLQELRKLDVNLESYLKTLSRDTEISYSELQFLLRFRKLYSFEELDDNRKWSTYRSQLYGKPERDYGQSKLF
jgi:hypothetical protein